MHLDLFQLVGIMLSVLLSGAAYVPLAGRSSVGRGARATGPVMAGTKKIVSFEQDGLFEGREISYQRPPVKFLSRVNELEVATAVSDAGLLSLAEENGVFSTLEGLGAFSLAEKALPTIEKLKLLSFAESLFDVEAGLIFTAANFLIVFTPVLLTLQICGFVPLPKDILFAAPELLVCGGTFAVGAALFVLALGISKLQETEEASYGPGGRTQPWFENLL